MVARDYGYKLKKNLLKGSRKEKLSFSMFWLLQSLDRAYRAGDPDKLGADH